LVIALIGSPGLYAHVMSRLTQRLSPRLALIVAVLFGAAGVAVRALRGGPAPAFSSSSSSADGGSPQQPWPSLRPPTPSDTEPQDEPEPVDPTGQPATSPAPDWTGPQAAPTDATPLSADPSPADAGIDDGPVANPSPS